MRDIKFRGLTSYRPVIEFTKEWVYGLPVCIGGVIKHGRTYMLTKKGQIEVDAETITQYTGLKDKNGVEIYDADYCKDNSARMGNVCFDNKLARWMIVWVDNRHLYPLTHETSADLEVIGNIYENPELLEDGK